MQKEGEVARVGEQTVIPPERATASENGATPTEFYAADASGKVEVWRIESRTAKTFTVIRDDPHWAWRRTLRSADIGEKVHRTREAALRHTHARLLKETGYASQQLQRLRTCLGIVEGAINRVIKEESGI